MKLRPITRDAAQAWIHQIHRHLKRPPVGDLFRVALGYVRFVTYTLAHEPGTSLRAAGFYDDGLNDGGEYDTPSRRRQPVEQSGPKRRWIWPSRKTTLWDDLKPLKAA